MNDWLIEKYFRGLCTNEEAVTVLAFLKANPDHPFLLKDWDDADNKTPLAEGYTQQMFDTIHAAIVQPVNKTRLITWKRLAVAAIVTGIIGSIFFPGNRQMNHATLAKVQEPHKLQWFSYHNTNKNDTVLLLADGSKITVSPDAVVRYRVNFNDYDKREIFMSGSVFFEVAKNKHKPFTVYSREIGTTALGTAFYVDAPEKSKRLKVKLLEGKVVVALADTMRYTAAEQYYLLPGQELVFDAVSKKGRINSFTAKNKNSIKNAEEKKQPLTTAGASYMFNNQTLSEVLDQLAVMYHADIRYSKPAIGNNYFIGKIDRDDSLEKIINDIALLNKLTVKKERGAYILRKK